MHINNPPGPSLQTRYKTRCRFPDPIDRPPAAFVVNIVGKNKRTHSGSLAIGIIGSMRSSTLRPYVSGLEIFTGIKASVPEHKPCGNYDKQPDDHQHRSRISHYTPADKNTNHDEGHAADDHPPKSRRAPIAELHLTDSGRNRHRMVCAIGAICPHRPGIHRCLPAPGKRVSQLKKTGIRNPHLEYKAVKRTVNQLHAAGKFFIP